MITTNNTTAEQQISNGLSNHITKSIYNNRTELKRKISITKKFNKIARAEGYSDYTEMYEDLTQ